LRLSLCLPGAVHVFRSECCATRLTARLSLDAARRMASGTGLQQHALSSTYSALSTCVELGMMKVPILTARSAISWPRSIPLQPAKSVSLPGHHHHAGLRPASSLMVAPDPKNFALGQLHGYKSCWDPAAEWWRKNLQRPRVSNPKCHRRSPLCMRQPTSRPTGHPRAGRSTSHAFHRRAGHVSLASGDPSLPVFRATPSTGRGRIGDKIAWPAGRPVAEPQYRRSGSNCEA